MLVNSVHLTTRRTLGRKCETFEALLSMQSACLVGVRGRLRARLRAKVRLRLG